MLSVERSLQILSVVSTCFPAPCLSSGGPARQILGVILWSLCLFCSPLTRLSRSHESELSLLLARSVCSRLRDNWLEREVEQLSDWRVVPLCDHCDHHLSSNQELSKHKKSKTLRDLPLHQSHESDHPLVCSVCLFKIARHLIQELPSFNN